MDKRDSDSTLRDFLDTLPSRSTFRSYTTSLPVMEEIIRKTIDGQVATEEGIRGAVYDLVECPPSTVYAAVHRIRQALNRFYSVEARDHAYRINIRNQKGGGWIAEVVANHLEIVDHLEFFWETYLAPSAQNVILYSEPLFFRRVSAKTDKRLYLRNVSANDSADRRFLTALLHDAAYKREEWVESYHYTSTGEVRGMLQLIQNLSFRPPIPARSPGQEKRIPLSLTADFRTARNMPQITTLPSANFVVLGNVRINSVYRDIQQERCEFMDYVLLDDRIEHRRCTPPQMYVDQETSSILITYGLLTRVQTIGSPHPIMLIGGNNGRAIQGICEHITDRMRLEPLCKALAKGNKLPDCFQVVFKVKIEHSGTNILSTETIDAVVYPPPQ